MKLSQFTFFAILFFLGLAHGQTSPIKIAYVGGLTGNLSQAAQRSLKALKLAVKKVNEKGGIRGRRVEVLAFDNKFSPVTNITIFEEIKKSGVVAVTGLHVSNDALVLSKLTEEARIPLIIASATHPAITKGQKYVTRVCFTDDAQGLALSEFAIKKLGRKSVVTIVDVSDSFTDYLSKTFSRHLSEMGGKVLATYPIRTNAKDFSEIMENIQRNKKPDMLFAAASAMESSYMISFLAKSKLRIPLMGSDGWQNSDLGHILRNLEQNDMEGFFSVHWHLDLPYEASKRFVRDYETEYKEKLTSFDADPVLTYDAGTLLLTALESSKDFAPDSIMSALRETSFDGVSGKIAFSKSPDAMKKVHILKISKGKLIPQEE